MPISDNHDQRMITETLNGTYSCTGSKTKKGGIIDASSESKEGDYSYYTSEKRANDFDTDLDGLPDWWENLIGTNVKSSSGDFSDSNADPDGDGYTNLEEYLYWMSIPHVETQTNTAASIDLSSYFKGFSKTSPSYSISENTNSLNINITNGKLTVSSSKSVIFYFKIKVKDTDNDEMIRTFGIYAEGEPAETTATLSKCGGGSSSQSIKLGDPLSSFCYTWTEASTVSASGFPKGISLNLDNAKKKITISGTHTETGTPPGRDRVGAVV